MHKFSDLARNTCGFTLSNLKEIEDKTLQKLKISAATPLIMNLQMIRLNKVVFAVGVFSIFEAILQENLKCSNGFEGVKKILKNGNHQELLDRFCDTELAINALKHGKGKSYNALIAKNGGTLRSQLKMPQEDSFFDGDMSEVNVLVDVDDDFIIDCVELIEEISKVLENNFPGTCI